MRTRRCFRRHPHSPQDCALPQRLPGRRAENDRRRLFSGELAGVVSTNALELGIDVGSLDAAVIVGFPPTIASTWQQAGRAGRSLDPALAVMVAYNEPIDQYLMRHPSYFFGQSPEAAVVDPHNPYLLAGSSRPRHTSCRSLWKIWRCSARRRASCSRRWRKTGRCARSIRAGTGRRAITPRRASTCARSPTTRSPSSTRRAATRCSARSTRAPRPSSCSPRRSISTRAARTTCVRWTWSRRSRTASRAKSTTTRSPCSTRTSSRGSPPGRATRSARRCNTGRPRSRGTRSA